MIDRQTYAQYLVHQLLVPLRVLADIKLLLPCAKLALSRVCDIQVKKEFCEKEYILRVQNVILSKRFTYSITHLITFAHIKRLKILRRLLTRPDLAARHNVAAARGHVHALLRIILARHLGPLTRVIHDFGEPRSPRVSALRARLFAVERVLPGAWCEYAKERKTHTRDAHGAFLVKDAVRWADSDMPTYKQSCRGRAR